MTDRLIRIINRTRRQLERDRIEAVRLDRRGERMLTNFNY